jgi:hypothetical protein
MRTKVLGIVEAAAVLRVGAQDPMLADHCKKRVALADALGKDVDEIAAGRDRIDIEEDVLPPEATRQSIVDSPCEPAGVLTPIADEDAACHIDASSSEHKYRKRTDSLT